MRRARWIVLFAALGLGLGSWGLLSVQGTTRQGVNFEVSSREIPLYVKALDFVNRHYQYRALAEEITRKIGSERERVLAVFDWTRRHIRPTPEGWTVVDDHILNVIIRGHGLDDQMADVFTTLSTYAGIPAFWQVLKPPDSGEKLVLSFAKVEGKWAVFDVANGLIFRNARGALASAEEIAAAPGLVRRTAGSLRHRGIPNERYFDGFVTPPAPRPLRAEQQMPWPRLRYKFRSLLSRALGTGDGRPVVQE